MVSDQVYYEDVECDGCGGPAVEGFLGKLQVVYPMCPSCAAHLRETMAEREEEECYCQDCEESPATQVFVESDGHEFMLCDACFMYAAQEEEPEYDWGEEQEGDFPAEDPESDSEDDEDDDEEDRWYWNDECDY
jgi:hypothetical protein